MSTSFIGKAVNELITRFPGMTTHMLVMELDVKAVFNQEDYASKAKPKHWVRHTAPISGCLVANSQCLIA